MSGLKFARNFFDRFFPAATTCCAGLATLIAMSGLAGEISLPDKSPAVSLDVRKYVVRGNVSLPPNVLDSIFARHMGTNVDLLEIARAAADLQAECLRDGFPAIGVAIGEREITNGIVTLNVFQASTPQIVIDGRTYFVTANYSAMAGAPTNPQPFVLDTPKVRLFLRTTPPTPEELFEAREALVKKMDELAVKEQDTRVHVISTNTGPRFEVENYLVSGNSILTPANLGDAITNVDGAYGTNVSLEGIQTVVEQLQKTYTDRGFGLTVNVGLPQQTLSNATVKVQVTEGRLAAINVKGNYFFSSNNVMRALPGLHTNMVLNSFVFQSELNQANLNQDRQIYPVIGPGPDPGTSELTLNVKDHLPLHGKTELDNASSPGTPVLREKSSLVYNNLWQMEHALGLAYGFSPEAYKSGNEWNFFDKPVVANYGGFYRLPLGGPQPVQDVIANNPGNFGYSEETRKFNLPPPTGQTELALFASRSTIDPGVQSLANTVLFDNPGVRTVTEQDVQQDITINQSLGFRIRKPLPEIDTFQSFLSGGLDFKSYSLTDYKTNIFSFLEITRKPDGSLNPPIISSVSSPVPVTDRHLEYLPLRLNYDGTLHGKLGVFGFGLGVSANLWHSGSSSNVVKVTGSSMSTGDWVTVTPSLFWSIPIYTNWNLLLNAKGQWASEPLVSSEQFGAGGINSVRGYHEGEVFGDDGWRLSVEQQTPPHVIGNVYGNTPLTVRGSIYMDYARAILIDPRGGPPAISLWGVGIGATASVGPHWDAGLLFSLPLSTAGSTEALQPFFNFSLSGQF